MDFLFIFLPICRELSFSLNPASGANSVSKLQCPGVLCVCVGSIAENLLLCGLETFGQRADNMGIPVDFSVICGFNDFL